MPGLAEDEEFPDKIHRLPGTYHEQYEMIIDARKNYKTDKPFIEKPGIEDLDFTNLTASQRIIPYKKTEAKKTHKKKNVEVLNRIANAFKKNASIFLFFPLYDNIKKIL